MRSICLSAVADAGKLLAHRRVMRAWHDIAGIHVCGQEHSHASADSEWLGSWMISWGAGGQIHQFCAPPKSCQLSVRTWLRLCTGLVRRQRLRGVARLDAMAPRKPPRPQSGWATARASRERALNSDVTTGNADRRWCVPETERSVCAAAMGESEHPGSRAERRLGGGDRCSTTIRTD